MMDIGVVRVAVNHRFVFVLVTVRLSAVPALLMGMLVVGVMPMAMRVDHAFMPVFVPMPLGQVQTNSRRHQR
jgi:hypothetical protein